MAYCRSLAAGRKGTQPPSPKWMYFLHALGQPLDWVYLGDPRS